MQPHGTETIATRDVAHRVAADLAAARGYWENAASVARAVRDGYAIELFDLAIEAGPSSSMA
jgi:hypothetical protein